MAVEGTRRQWGEDRRRDHIQAIGSFRPNRPVGCRVMGVGVSSLGGRGSSRNRSFEWRLKTTVAVEGTRRQWGDESRRDHIPAMGSNFGRIGPSVAKLWTWARWGLGREDLCHGGMRRCGSSSQVDIRSAKTGECSHTSV